MVHQPHANPVKIKSSGSESSLVILLLPPLILPVFAGRQVAAESDFMFWVLLLDKNMPILLVGIRYRIT